MAIFILALMFSLTPHADRAALTDRAVAIASVAAGGLETRVLVAIDFRETTFQHGIPFGLSCCWREGWTLERGARKALDIWRTGLQRCGSPEGGFRFYNTGGCQAGPRPRHLAARRLWTRGRRYGRVLMRILFRLPTRVLPDAPGDP
jgi:hypothetical protein